MPTDIVPQTTDTHRVYLEPDDGNALYWPQDTYGLATILVRDDATAAAIVDGRPDAHWFLPNNVDPPLTWAEVLTFLAEEELPPDDAIRLTTEPAPSSAIEPHSDLRALADLLWDPPCACAVHRADEKLGCPRHTFEGLAATAMALLVAHRWTPPRYATPPGGAA